MESEDVRTYIVVWDESGRDESGVHGPGQDTPFTLQPEEITEGRFWSFHEIREHIGKGILTPNFEQEFDRYIQWRAQQRRTE